MKTKEKRKRNEINHETTLATIKASHYSERTVCLTLTVEAATAAPAATTTATTDFVRYFVGGLAPIY